MPTEKKKKFDWATCELSGYRRGFVTVKLDFKSNILSWKASNHWYNNFVRGLPRSQMEPLYQSIEEFIDLHNSSIQVEKKGPQDYVWIVQVGRGEQISEFKGNDITSEAWLALERAIEKVAQREFKL